MRIIFSLFKSIVLIGFGFWLAIYLDKAELPQFLDKERLDSGVKAVGEQIKEYVPESLKLPGTGDDPKVGNTDKLTAEDRKQLNELIQKTTQ